MRKLIALVLSMFMTVNALAGDNSIYISQAGSGTSVSVTQDGVSNIVQALPAVGNTNTTPAVINGDNNTVAVTQTGNSNTLSMGIQTAIANGASGGNSYTYSVTGNNSEAIIDSNGDGNGRSESNTLTASQTGNYSKLWSNILGTTNNVSITTAGGQYNTVYSTVNGANINQTVDISGGGNNTVSINQGIGGSALGSNLWNISGTATALTDSFGTVDLTIVGASNTVSIDQEGGDGNAGHSATINLNGSGNLATISQYGSTNSIINLRSVGSNNTFTLTSHQ